MTRFLWDASALAKRFLPEVGTPTVNALFAAGIGAAHTVTYLGYAETAAVLLRRRNAGGMSRAELAVARDTLERSVLSSTGFDLLSIEDADILAGMALTNRHNINTADAAILAAYLRLSGFPDEDGVFLIVSDHRLERAARFEGLATLDPARTAPDEFAGMGLG